MRYLSVCSGIEAATVAWHSLNWTPVAFSEIEAFPSAVINHHYPSVPNLGDLTKINGTTCRGQVDLVVGGTPCFPAGTLITTKSGFVPIEAVQVGDLVLTHQLRWQRVLRTGSKFSETVVVKGQGHPGMVTTEEHPYYTRTKKGFNTKVSGQYIRRTVISDPQWTNAKDLEGHHWASVAAFPSADVPPIMQEDQEKTPPPIIEELLWLAGAYVGDGWTRINERRGSTIFGVNAAKAAQIKEKCRAVGLNVTETQERTGPKITVYGRALARWLHTHFGAKADGKRFPVWSLGIPAPLRRSMLDGYVAMDGTVATSCRGHRIATVGRELAFTTRMLANSLGHASSIMYVVPKREQCVVEGRVVNERPYYTVTISNSERSSFEVDGMRFGLVRSVTPSARTEQVWNLEVEGDNSYVADGFVVHNCQAFSIAGLRNSLADDRGNLSLKFVELCNDIAPKFIVWENVPGVLSTKDNAFGCFLAGLAGEDEPLLPPGGKWTHSGYVLGPERAIAWRILDAQYFGLAQRRKRVFVVASPRASGLDPREVLFECDGLRRDSTPSREAGAGFTHDVAPRLGASGRGVARPGETRGQDPVVAVGCYDDPRRFDGLGVHGGGEHGDIHPTLRATNPAQVLIVAASVGGNCSGPISVGTALTHHAGRYDLDSETFVTHTLRGEGFDASEDGTGRDTPLVPVAFEWAASPSCSLNPSTIASMLKKGTHPATFTGTAVRRLTPTECERLQGFPDGYTQIPWAKKTADKCPDGHRYKALGNSMAVPVMQWIGKRIQAVLDRAQSLN